MFYLHIIISSPNPSLCCASDIIELKKIDHQLQERKTLMNKKESHKKKEMREKEKGRERGRQNWKYHYEQRNGYVKGASYAMHGTAAAHASYNLAWTRLEQVSFHCFCGQSPCLNVQILALATL